MRLSTILTVIAALGLAVIAGLLSQTWLEQQRRAALPKVIERPVATNKIVVATQSLRFGNELAAVNLNEIDWPAANVPAGAFTSISELLKPGERRVVLSAIEINEPILKWKVTGPGQRASLSSLIEPGMKAITIRVNDVFGVAGFVLPGDRVDVLLTKLEAQQAAKKDSYTDVLLQNVRVLAVDQLADDRTEKPSVAKAVTLEVKTEDSQRITLAGSLGNLSLSLRPAGVTQVTLPNRITAGALDAEAGIGSGADAHAGDRNRVVVITRSVTRSNYTVPPSSFSN